MLGEELTKCAMAALTADPCFAAAPHGGDGARSVVHGVPNLAFGHAVAKTNDHQEIPKTIMRSILIIKIDLERRRVKS